MKYYIADIVRRVEILARAINEEEMSKADYGHEFNVAQVTINRDLEWLREFGIEIFSRKNIIQLTKTPPKEVINKLLAEYLPLKLNSDIFLQQVRTFSKKEGISYFSNLTLIAKAVNEGKFINISYQRLSDDEIHKYILKPVRLFCSGYNWILHAFKDGDDILKSFYITRIKSIALKDKKFKSLPLAEEKKEAVKIIFRFPLEVASEINDKIWFDEFNIFYDEKGYILLETNQEISIRLATWCIGWWDKIEIVEPKALVTFINEMIESFKRNN
jgi:predicted DNA-binding transcriptional regulator YafY